MRSMRCHCLIQLHGCTALPNPHSARLLLLCCCCCSSHSELQHGAACLLRPSESGVHISPSHSSIGALDKYAGVPNLTLASWWAYTTEFVQTNRASSARSVARGPPAYHPRAPFLPRPLTISTPPPACPACSAADSPLVTAAPGLGRGCSCSL